MSRKDYIKLAKVVRNVNSDIKAYAWGSMLQEKTIKAYTERLIDQMCVMLEEDNKYFCPPKFKAACLKGEGDE